MKERLDHPVSVCLTQRQYVALNDYADSIGQPVGKLVRELIVQEVPYRYYSRKAAPPGQLTLMEAEGLP